MEAGYPTWIEVDIRLPFAEDALTQRFRREYQSQTDQYGGDSPQYNAYAIRGVGRITHCLMDGLKAVNGSISICDRIENIKYPKVVTAMAQSLLWLEKSTFGIGV